MDNLQDFPYHHSRDFKLASSLTDENLQDLCGMIRSRMSQLISDTPKVSVVFPAYNEEMYLPLMLWTLSKLATNIPIEIIGVNNASTDRTGEIISQSGIIRVDEPRKGVSYARQTGLETARGDIVATTDADAQIPETWIDASMSYFEQDSRLICFSGGSVPIGAHYLYFILEYLRKFLRTSYGKPPDCLSSFPGNNTFFIRQMAIGAGGYPLGSDLGEDNILVSRIRALDQGEILRICSNVNTLVHISGRRFSTSSRICNIVHQRWNSVLKDYNNLPSGKIFLDVR